MKDTLLDKIGKELPDYFLNPSDRRSISAELMNLVKHVIDLDATDDNQLLKAVVSLSSSNSYVDMGSTNLINLFNRNDVETEEGSGNYKTYLNIVDGTILFFSPKAVNTGATTLKTVGVDPKPLLYDNSELYPGILRTYNIYAAKYDETNDVYHLYNMTSGNMTESPVVDISTNVTEASQVLATITNFSTSAKYTITAKFGTLEINSNGTFYYTAPETDVDFIDTLTLTAVKSGETLSKETLVFINVHATTIEADILASNSSFEENAFATNNITF